MPEILLVVNHPARWPLSVPGVEIVAARDYLTAPRFNRLKHCRVYNLCRSYRYQTIGYYVSLLAEARGHRPVPQVGTIQDLKYQSLFKVVSEDLDDLIQKSLAPLVGEEFTLSIYFSRNLAKRYSRLARDLYNLFPVPLLRSQFRKLSGRWVVQNISPISMNDIPHEHRDAVLAFAEEYFRKPVVSVRRRVPPRFGMALLAGPEDPTPPSDEKALQRFIDAAADLGIAAERITFDDYGRLAEYDALFIRHTTAVNNQTYRFARRAQAEGIVVIDDPQSIVRCTNKVYLAELLSRYKIPLPRTEILHKDNRRAVRAQLGLPCILKQPDSSFSQGVVKVDDESEFEHWSRRLLEKSDLLIAQEFIQTDFDWRIGILDQKPLYACKYFMARNHWQIYNNSAGPGNTDDFAGDFETLPVELAPPRVVNTALRAANLIGNGLYGVDLKQKFGKCYIIEVNDNPSIDSGVEDKILGRFLYERIMESFLRRIEAAYAGSPGRV